MTQEKLFNNANVKPTFGKRPEDKPEVKTEVTEPQVIDLDDYRCSQK